MSTGRAAALLVRATGAHPFEIKTVTMQPRPATLEIGTMIDGPYDS